MFYHFKFKVFKVGVPKKSPTNQITDEGTNPPDLETKSATAPGRRDRSP